MRLVLVNTNRIRPPIAPIGLEYVAEAAHAAGFGVTVLDLCWEADWQAALDRTFRGTDVGLVGMTLRNTDDCAWGSSQGFVPEFARMVRTVREYTDAPVLVGGVGFSVMPEAVLGVCGATAGVAGDGEAAIVEVGRRLDAGEDWRDVPGLVWNDGEAWRRNPPLPAGLDALPRMSRGWVDNRRYFAEGGQAGFETKRGCAQACIYCADPVAKGRLPRVRPPAAVADEVGALLAQGIDHLHTCDSEFNLPEWHARAVCHELNRRGLGERARWYAYASPTPFSGELARLMRQAGCVGINFGVDSGDDRMLARLGRGHSSTDIGAAVRVCHEAGIVVMLDLLLGGPGETRASLERTIGLMRELRPERVGVTVGLRVYPGTALAQWVNHPDLRSGLSGGPDPLRPLFFLEPAVAGCVFPYLDKLIGDDERFLFFDPTRPDRNYNYNANQRLQDAIAAGHRGAFWDILRRYRP